MIQFVIILILLYFIFNLEPSDTNVGSMGYKSKNFGMSHGMSYKIVNEMKRKGRLRRNHKKFTYKWRINFWSGAERRCAHKRLDNLKPWVCLIKLNVNSSAMTSRITQNI